MSVPKYVKGVSKNLRTIKSISIFTIFIIIIIWVIRVAIDLPDNPLLVLLFPEFFILIGTICIYAYLYLRTWKLMIYSAESDIFETIAYRDKTSIKNVASIKKLKEKTVELILKRLLEQEKLFGIIKDGLFISEKTMKPICSLCNKEISDRLLMVLCPYCKRTFHKDHLIDYINEMESICPNCKHEVWLGDIIK